MAKLPAAPIRIGKGVNPGKPESVVGQPCSNPSCDFDALDAHHLTRRSHLGGPFNEVEIDGIVLPNVASLCRSCHRDVEEMRAQIILADRVEDGEKSYYYSWWADGMFKPLRGPLGGVLGRVSISPPLVEDASERLDSSVPADSESPLESSEGVSVKPEEWNPASSDSTSTKGESVDDSVVTGSGPDLPPEPVQSSPEIPCPHITLEPGEKCECGYKKPHDKKATSPKSKPISLRIPQPVRAEFAEIEEAVFEHLGISKEPFARYKAVLSGYISLLQGEGKARAA